MTGLPYFNGPWFDGAAEFLRKVPGVTEVFNPAEHDRAVGFDPIKCTNGTREEAAAQGFSYRDALRDDLRWILNYSDGMVAGASWTESPGTIAEIALHQALRKPVWEYGVLRFLELHGMLRQIDDPHWHLPVLTDWFN